MRTSEPPGHPPDRLELTLSRRPHFVALRVAGDLDLSNADRLTQAVCWLGRRADVAMIVIDTRDLRFVDLSGYRAVTRARYGAPGVRVMHVVGDTVARLQDHLAAAARGGPNRTRTTLAS